MTAIIYYPRRFQSATNGVIVINVCLAFKTLNIKLARPKLKSVPFIKISDGYKN